MGPKKSNKGKNETPRERKKLINRIKMLKRNKENARKRKKERSKIREIEKSIMETQRKLIEHRQQERNLKEKRVIENMKEKPKLFFDYIRKKKLKTRRLDHSRKGRNMYMIT